MNHYRKANILGVAVDVTNYDSAVKKVLSLIKEDEHHYICVASTQDIIIAQRDVKFKRIVNNADLVTADGWPVVWAMELSGMEQRGRVTGPDLMLEVCKESINKRYSHYFFGGAPGVPELLSKKLGQKYPGLIVKGAFSPPFKEIITQESEEILKMLNSSKADILWIGLSTPKQQYWIESNLDKINIPVVFAVGAAFDFHSGRIKRAPVWMQKYGLEWFYRLCQEPKRLWKRYFIFLPKFAFLFAGQLLKLKHYDIEK